MQGRNWENLFFWLPIDDKQLESKFLEFYARTPYFIEQVLAKGSTNYAAIRPSDVLGYVILLPPLEEQRRIVARIEELAAKIEEARGFKSDIQRDIHRLLLAEYKTLTSNVKTLPMGEVAPLIRRPVQINLSEQYYELGIRSFGKGTFHKPSIGGTELGEAKKINSPSSSLA